MGQNSHNKVEKKTKNEPERGATWPATQVGLRGVEAGLGGHDDGSSGGRRGGQKHIESVMETVSIGIVGSSNLQWFCGGRQSIYQ